jgi:hypothetical protein
MVLCSYHIQYQKGCSSMKRNTMIKILRGLNAGNGVGAVRFFHLAQVVFLSGVPRMTTYRYLRDAVALGLVETEKEMYRNQETTWYAITKAGCDFAGVVR